MRKRVGTFRTSEFRILNWFRISIFVLRIWLGLDAQTQRTNAMNLSAKTEYAAIAMMELAASYGSGDPVRIRKIADAHGIPNRFLVQILLQLKAAGFVTSTRGAAGGYELVRDPATVTLLDIIEAVEGQSGPAESNAEVETPGSRVLLAAWREVAENQRRQLAEISLADLVSRVRSQASGMFYI